MRHSRWPQRVAGFFAQLPIAYHGYTVMPAGQYWIEGRWLAAMIAYGVLVSAVVGAISGQAGEDDR